MKSCLPLPDYPSDIPVPGEAIFLIESLYNTPLHTKQVANWTNQDPILSRVRNLVGRERSDVHEPDLAPYIQRQNELSVTGGCILWGSRAIVPLAGRQEALRMLHEGHLGMSRIKAKARSLIWWPGMDMEIEEMVKKCQQCQLTRHNPATTPEPWKRIHIDYAGLFVGKWYLLVMDAHSKWLEVEIVNSTNTSTTVEKLRQIFATHGLSSTMVSHNGSVFTSEEFSTYLNHNGIHHIRITPYHPASNGQVERAVQIFKESIKRSTTGSLETRVNRFLFHYRTTPHTTTGVTPAELLMGRRLHTHLVLIHPDLMTRYKGNKKDKHRIETRSLKIVSSNQKRPYL